MADSYISKSKADLLRAQTEKKIPATHGMSFDDLMNCRGPSLPDAGARGLLTTKEGLNEFIVRILRDPEERTSTKLQAAKQLAELNGIGSDEGGDLRNKSNEEMKELLELYAPLMREFLRPPPNPLMDKKIQKLIREAAKDPDRSVNIRSDIANTFFASNMTKAKKLVEQMFRFGLGRPADIRRGKRGAPQRRFVFDWTAVEKCQRALEAVDPTKVVLEGFEETPPEKEPVSEPVPKEVA